MTTNQSIAALATGLLAGILASVLIGATMLGLYLVWGIMGAMLSAVLVPSVAGMPQIASPTADAAIAASLGATLMVLVGPFIA